MPNVPCNENGHYVSPHSAQQASNVTGPATPTTGGHALGHHHHISSSVNHCNINPTSKPIGSGNLLVDTRPSGKHNSHKSSVESNAATTKRVVEVYPT